MTTNNSHMTKKLSYMTNKQTHSIITLYHITTKLSHMTTTLFHMTKTLSHKHCKKYKAVVAKIKLVKVSTESTDEVISTSTTIDSYKVQSSTDTQINIRTL